jgi:methyl-accepting chemotaxis protein
MLRHLRIRSKLFVVVAVPVVVLLISGFLAFASIQVIKINGPTYNAIKTQDDLIADILPPPEFAIEAYATALQLVLEEQQNASGTAMASDAQHKNNAMSSLRTLELEFEARHTFWLANLTSAGAQPSRELLDGEVYQSGRAMFDIIDKGLLPAIAAGDAVKADQIRDTQLAPAFEVHQQAVQRLVSVAETRAVGLETGAATTVRNRLLALGLVLLGAIAACVILGTLIARRISRPIVEMTERAAHVANVGLPAAIAAITSATDEDVDHGLEAFPVETNDELGELATAFNAVQAAAVDLAGQQVRMNRNYGENLITIGRRNQGLVFRTLGLISELESNERDAATLESLFRLDHLTTRMRRQAESLLVLAGDTPTSALGGPVEMADVIRGALSEVDDYQRVDHNDMDVVTVRGRYVHSVVHMFAELLENAISYSPPNARVTLLGRITPSGYHVAMIDRGLGMSTDEVDLANERLENPAMYDHSPVRVLGHHVVSKLSQRYGIQVRLHDNLPAPGITVSVLLPIDLLGSDSISPASAPVSTPEPSSGAVPVRSIESSSRASVQKEATLKPYDEFADFATVNAGVSVPMFREDAGEMLSLASFIPVWPPPDEDSLYIPPNAMWPGTEGHVGEMTKTGFPKRIRGAQKPDTGPARVEPTGERDTEALRSSLSGLQSGFDRAKQK